MAEVKKFSAIFSPQAEKQMDKLDASVRRRIARWVKDNLADCENPRLYGDALHNVLKEYWRYRVGDYRIVAKILDAEVVILIVKIGKRGDVYK